MNQTHPRLKYWDMELALLYGDKQNLVHCMHVRCDSYIATETARSFSLDKLRFDDSLMIRSRELSAN